MQLGMIGLGRMGANMAERLVRGGHRVVGFDASAAAPERAGANGIEAAGSLADLVARLERPRAVWIMLPAGEITDATVAALLESLDDGDTIVDGGNSNYKDTLRRADAAAAKSIAYVDCGT